MKKLKLVMDELLVESFETVTAAERRGTVVGRVDSSADGIGCQNLCSGACLPTDVSCDPDACAGSVVLTCLCMSAEWACPTDACPDPTAAGQAGC